VRDLVPWVTVLLAPTDHLMRLSQLQRGMRIWMTTRPVCFSFDANPLSHLINKHMFRGNTPMTNKGAFVGVGSSIADLTQSHPPREQYKRHASVESLLVTPTVHDMSNPATGDPNTEKYLCTSTELRLFDRGSQQPVYIVPAVTCLVVALALSVWFRTWRRCDGGAKSTPHWVPRSDRTWDEHGRDVSFAKRRIGWIGAKRGTCDRHVSYRPETLIRV